MRLIPIGHILFVEVLPLILCTHTHTFMYTHTCMLTHTMHAHIYVCTHAPTHTQLCTHTHTHTRITRVHTTACTHTRAHSPGYHLCGADSRRQMQQREWGGCRQWKRKTPSSTSSQCWTTPQSHLKNLIDELRPSWRA